MKHLVYSALRLSVQGNMSQEISSTNFDHRSSFGLLTEVVIADPLEIISCIVEMIFTPLMMSFGLTLSLLPIQRTLHGHAR